MTGEIIQLSKVAQNCEIRAVHTRSSVFMSFRSLFCVYKPAAVLVEKQELVAEQLFLWLKNLVFL